MAGRSVFLVLAVSSVTCLLSAPSISSAAKATKKDTPQEGDLASFLISPAEQAMAKRNYPLAISIYRGIVAVRGDGDESAWNLSQAWTLAGQFDAAAEEIERYRDAVSNPEKRTRAEAEIDALRSRTEGFSGRVFELVPAKSQAAVAFKMGRKLFGAKKYAEAILLFKAGYLMAPDLPGNLRELGESYDKLGRSGEANDFFVRYLKMRPFGNNANKVRERLQKAGLVGKLTIDSSFPCELVMVNRQLLPTKLPIQGMVVAPGKYKLLCYNSQYHLAHYDEATVAKGDSVRVTFAWAILENKLDPWGRIVLENPDAKRAGQMFDIGTWEEIGVPVPDDRRALKVVLRAGDGSKSKELFLKIEAGKRILLTW
ncbi:MAG: tetratricopeptide repeat protein [Deltaproteobacteria bacterium]|nr:tetratricopeptide repeat protein [Deltaproteobacteria bacterium]